MLGSSTFGGWSRRKNWHRKVRRWEFITNEAGGKPGESGVTQTREGEEVVSWHLLLKGQVRFGKRSDMNKNSLRGEMGKEGSLIEGRLKKELQMRKL